MPQHQPETCKRNDCQLRDRFLEPADARDLGLSRTGVRPPKMVAHVSDQLRMDMGEIASAPQSRVLSVRPAAWLMIYVIPWPHGAKGPREAFTTSPAEWQHDVEALKVLVDRLPQWEPPGDWPVHPLFGPLTRRDWGAVSYKHFDHHLRQFAV